MSLLFLGSLALVLLAAWLSGPFRLLPLLVASPILLALLASLFEGRFDLSIPAALLLAVPTLLLLLLLPMAAIRALTARKGSPARPPRRPAKP